MTPLKLRTILLFPPHLSPNPTTLPLLTALQSLLNISYTATYCTRPDIFGTSHLRLADPTKFTDFIGVDGFTIAIFAVKSDRRQHPIESSEEDRVDSKGGGELAELVATGSVEAVDDEDIRKHAQWVPRTARAPREETGRNDAEFNSISTQSEELNEKLEALYHERLNPPQIHELRAFAVSPKQQGLGLGASVLKSVEWLLGKVGARVLEFSRGVDKPFSSGGLLLSSFELEKGELVYGIDLDEVKGFFDRSRNAHVAASETKQLGKDAANDVETLRRRKIVLVAIRELGNEEYYQRRGYKSIGAGILPLGVWGSRAECTAVYMEKSL